MPRTFTIIGQNFREIGPLRGRDGRRLKQGRLFRTGDLSEASPACVAEMQSLGICSVVDLRSVKEREHHRYDWLPDIDPDPWGDPALTSNAAVSQLVRQDDATVDDMMHGMRRLYRALPFSHAESYATLFRRVAQGRVPLLFGCAAGKDRTGVAAALLLWSIGIDHDDIMHDYLLTNESLPALQALAARKFGWQAESPKSKAGLSADPSFLEAALDSVTERCGGIDAYVETKLGLTPAERRAIERELLD